MLFFKKHKKKLKKIEFNIINKKLNLQWNLQWNLTHQLIKMKL